MTDDFRVIPLQEFQTHTQRMEQVCCDWLAGTVTNEVFLQISESEFSEPYAIAEITTDDDEFDWDLIPDDLMEASENALETHRQVRKLLQAVRQAIRILETTNTDDLLGRAAHLGFYLREYGFDYSHLYSRHGTKSSRLINQLPSPKP